MIKELLCAIAVSAVPLAAADISGAWTVSGDIAGHEINLNCNFRQTENNLTGTCKGGDRPDRAVTGEVNGQKVKFQYDINYEGNKMTAVYSGILQSAKVVKGSIDVSGNSGDFTATKQ